MGPGANAINPDEPRATGDGLDDTHHEMIRSVVFEPMLLTVDVWHAQDLGKTHPRAGQALHLPPKKKAKKALPSPIVKLADITTSFIQPSLLMMRQTSSSLTVTG
jgi:hypothetical protein